MTADKQSKKLHSVFENVNLEHHVAKFLVQINLRSTRLFKKNNYKSSQFKRLLMTNFKLLNRKNRDFQQYHFSITMTTLVYNSRKR